MIVLHAGIYENSLAFWAETSTPVAKRSRKQTPMPINIKTVDDQTQHTTKNSNRYSSERRYKFSTSLAQLQDLMKMVGVKPKIISRSYILLPTRENHDAVASSALIADEHDNIDTSKKSSKIKLEEWWVYAAILDGEDVTNVLTNIIDKRTIKPGIAVGADATYISSVLDFAASLAMRQQFIPDVERDAASRDYRAIWKPLITGYDSKKFKELAESMPDAIWAFTSVENRYEIPRGKPIAILSKLLVYLLSNIIRASLPVSKTPSFYRRKKFDSVHDEWLYKLRTRKTNVITRGDAGELRRQIREWNRPMITTTGLPIRLCFRLEEPKENEDEWFVRYMLQSRNDPSLLVPANEAWDSESSILPRGADTKEFLLSSLGQASGIFQGIMTGLQGRNDSIRINNQNIGIGGCHLDSEGAHKFLTSDAAALEQAGYGVILPAWWTGKGTKTRIKVKGDVNIPNMKAPGMLNLDSIMQFDWSVAMGDKNVTMTELEKLARAKSSLVRVRGEWVEVSTDDIKHAISFLKKRTKKASLLDAIRMRLGGSDTAGMLGTKFKDDESDPSSKSGMDVEITSNDDHILEVFDSLDGKSHLEEIKQPDGFCGTLRPYQVRGLSWLAFLQRWGLGGCLADDMGLGKTIQILALAQLLQHKTLESKNKSYGSFLLVCPTSVISNWQKEAARFVPALSVYIHHGTNRIKNAAGIKKLTKHYDIIITSYGLLHRDLKILKNVTWGSVILDEAQNIKNAQTKQSRAARMIKSASRFALTGTPVENNVGDLWPIMEFMNPGFLGTQAAFKRNFFLPIQTAQDTEAAEKLKQATGPFILRRLKTDKTVISDLPEKIETKTYCSLTKEQASLYKAVLADVERALEGDEAEQGIKRKGVILSSLARLKQVCDHPALFLKDNSDASDASSGRIRSGKILRLTEMLSEIIDVGDSALVFTQFVEMGHILRRHLQETFGLEVMFLHGGTSRKQRDEMVRKFQGDDAKQADNSRIFIVSVKAGGTGLNLTAANHVFHFDRWWNPAVEDQATDRAFRIGQKKNVQVHKMICSGTLEEKIDFMIEQKKDVTEKVIGTGEGWITEMSNEDLRDVLSLSTEAASVTVMTQEGGSSE